MKTKKGRKIRSELNPDVSISKQGKRIVLKVRVLLRLLIQELSISGYLKGLLLGGLRLPLKG